MARCVLLKVKRRTQYSEVTNGRGCQNTFQVTKHPNYRDPFGRVVNDPHKKANSRWYKPQRLLISTLWYQSQTKTNCRWWAQRDYHCSSSRNGVAYSIVICPLLGVYWGGGSTRLCASWSTPRFGVTGSVRKRVQQQNIPIIGSLLGEW